MPSTLRALRNPNYRLFFAGQLTSMIGTWMQQTVQAWLVYRISHSGWWLGAIVFTQQVPAFLLSPIAGIAADHRDRRKILIVVEMIAMIEAFVLAVLVYSGKISLLEIALLSMILGITTAFEITTRHAFAIDLVGRDDLDSAISLNSITINGSRVVGPALGGLLIPWLGEAGCFTLNGLSYVAIIWGLMRMKLPVHKVIPGGLAAPWKEIRETWEYLGTQPRIVRLLGVAFALTLFGSPYNVLLPIFAKDVLHGNANTLAWMTGVAGLGAVMAAIARGGQISEGASVRRGVVTRVIAQGFMLCILSFSKTLWLSLIATGLCGFSMMGAFLLINNTIQRQVRNSMRGRVMALYTMSFLGAAPLGGLLSGWLTDHWGVGTVTLGLGAVLLMMGIYAGTSLSRFLAKAGWAG